MNFILQILNCELILADLRFEHLNLFAEACLLFLKLILFDYYSLFLLFQLRVKVSQRLLEFLLFAFNFFAWRCNQSTFVVQLLSGLVQTLDLVVLRNFFFLESENFDYQVVQSEIGLKDLDLDLHFQSLLNILNAVAEQISRLDVSPGAQFPVDLFIEIHDTCH